MSPVPLITEGTHPSAVVGPPFYAPDGTPIGTTVVVKRGGMVGLAIGVLGLLAALAAVLFLIYGPHRKTTIVNVQSPPAPTETAAAPATEQPKSVDTAPKPEEPVAIPVDSLGPAPRKTWGGGGRPVPPPTKPSVTPPPPPATTGAPPRKNPYE